MPTARSTSPERRAARAARFSAAVMEPVNRATRTPAGGEQLVHGAVMLLSQHFGGRHQRGLPAALGGQPNPRRPPWSYRAHVPWTSRFMGRPEARSRAVSSMARRWAWVGAKGAGHRTPPRDGGQTPRRSTGCPDGPSEGSGRRRGRTAPRRSAAAAPAPGRQSPLGNGCPGRPAPPGPAGARPEGWPGGILPPGRRTALLPGGSGETIR